MPSNGGAPQPGQQLAHAGMDSAELLQGDQTAGHDRLIRDHHQSEPGRLQATQSLRHTVQNSQLLRATQQAQVFHQHAVAIQKHSPVAHRVFSRGSFDTKGRFLTNRSFVNRPKVLTRSTIVASRSDRLLRMSSNSM